MLLELAIAFIIAYLIWFYFFDSDPSFPPGPKGLPGFGVLPQHFTFLDFSKWKQRYKSGILGYRTNFGTRVFVIADHTAAKEILVRQGEKLQDRPHEKYGLLDSGGNYGLLGENGDTWVEQRRFALSTLRDFGFGKPIVEEKIHIEVQALVKALEAAATASPEGVDFSFMIQATVSNVISQITFGRRFEYSDRGFFDIIDCLVFRTSTANIIRGWSFPLAIVELIPSIRREVEKIIGEGDKIRAYLQDAKLLQGIISNERERCTQLAADEPASFVDAFVRKQKLGDGQFFSDQQLKMAVQHLFEAGTETTGTTIRWAILYLMRQPEIQEKVHAEIRSVLGLQRLPSMADRARLPFTEAVILEASRIRSLVPGLARQVTPGSRITYGDYVLKAGDHVVLSVWSLHMDPAVWPDPEEFRPQRFLGQDGRIQRTTAELVLNFGTGKRKCLGESLARMELFIIFTTLMQRLRFAVPKGCDPPGLDYEYGITLHPKPFKACITSRVDE